MCPLLGTFSCPLVGLSLGESAVDCATPSGASSPLINASSSSKLSAGGPRFSSGLSSKDCFCCRGGGSEMASGRLLYLEWNKCEVKCISVASFPGSPGT